MRDENTFYSAPSGDGPTATRDGLGNGKHGPRGDPRRSTPTRASTLAAVLVSSPAKVGRDAGDLAGLDRALGVAATDDVDAALAALGGAGAVAYMASGDIRPDDAAADVARCLRARRRRGDPGALRALRPPQRAAPS